MSVGNGGNSEQETAVNSADYSTVQSMSTELSSLFLCIPLQLGSSLSDPSRTPCTGSIVQIDTVLYCLRTLNCVLAFSVSPCKLEAVAFEPRHGRFARGHPWPQYRQLSCAVRALVYDVIALEGCLGAQIQAPTHLRAAVQGEVQAVADNCAR